MVFDFDMFTISAAAATANGSLSKPVSKSQEENRDSKAVPATPVEVSGGDNGELRNSDAGLPAVGNSPSKDAATNNQEVSAGIANGLVDDTGSSEEVNETPERPSAQSGYNNMGHEGGQEEYDDDDDNEGNEEEEVEHPGEVSIGKKIWTFITT